MAKNKKTSATDSFVTQSQWTEGMEMIKDFFGKMFKELQEQKKEIKGVKTQVGGLTKRVGGLEKQVGGLQVQANGLEKQVGGLREQVSGIEKNVGGLRYEFDEFRKEQRETNERLEKKIEVNTDSVSSLTTELRKVKNLEFEVYNHGERITKLEKAR
ncbi:MAG: hypothetical protein O3A36_00875 [bacterium]|nr:hypothetical protein [bacterium]